LCCGIDEVFDLLLTKAFLNFLKNKTKSRATLAMRHIEDARMRYGKVLQYLGD